MRAVTLTTAAGGIDRQRTKGGPATDTLYDLLNGYVDQTGAVVSRPGITEQIELAASTKGLVAFNDKLYTFTHTSADASTGGNPDYVVEVIKDPSSPSSAIARIHFAAAYLGYLYVVAEFASGNTWHYWLQAVDGWTAKTPVSPGDMMQPTTPNGFIYRAHRLTDPNPVWTPGTPRSSSPASVVEPTEGNGFKYTCTATSGTNPRSGETEPTWPESSGATVVEYSDVPATAVTPQQETNPRITNPNNTFQPPPFVRERYDNRLIE